jgi:hypothetical protein
MGAGRLIREKRNGRLAGGEKAAPRARGVRGRNKGLSCCANNARTIGIVPGKRNGRHCGRPLVSHGAVDLCGQRLEVAHDRRPALPPTRRPEFRIRSRAAGARPCVDGQGDSQAAASEHDRDGLAAIRGARTIHPRCSGGHAPRCPRAGQTRPALGRGNEVEGGASYPAPALSPGPAPDLWWL